MRFRIAFLVLVAGIASITGLSSDASAAGTSMISGSVFNDADRDGLRDPDEAPFAGRELRVSKATGELVGYAVTDSTGRFAMAGLDDGSYRVWMATVDWEPLRDDWVPTTSASLRFERYVTVSGTASADLGLRRIVRSTTDGSPISAVTGPDGLRVESYNDAVAAQEIYDELHSGSLLGQERSVTRVRFDLGDTNVTHSSWAGAEGAYTSFSATVDSDYLMWLTVGNKSLFHEYGHAWSLYHALMVQQTESLDSYLEARGLLGDPRVGSNVFWDPIEMIAEDYRQLFGSGAALTFGQANTEIPRAVDVPGLREWLRDTFTNAPAGDPSSSPTSPSPEPAPTALELSGVGVNPNPVSTSGSVSFTISVPATVSVDILDASGSVVRALVAGASRDAGSGSVTWDRKNEAGRKVKAGSYTARVVATDSTGAVASALQPFSVVDLVKSGRK